MPKNKTPQEVFDRKYITSSEIEKTLRVQRSSVIYARKRGVLPDPIRVGGLRLFIWERDKVEPFIDAWKISLASQRRELI